MFDLPFMMFIIEEDKKEQFIEALAREPDPNDPMVQDEIAYRLGIDTSFWTKWEKEEIGREVAKRWRG
jgi:hypothetical protein